MDYQGCPRPVNFPQLGARLRSGLNGSLPLSSLLVILDLHGVLVQRVRSDDKGTLAASRQQRPHWGKISKHFVWNRPYLREFFTLASARYNIAIWSAAKEQNVMPILEAISTNIDLHPPLTNQFKFIAHREDCRPDPESGKFAVVKLLPDFWRQSKHTQRDTVIVDDTISKVRFDSWSAVIVPEYNVENYYQTFNTDDTLLWLLLYLEYLVEASGLDSNGPGIALTRPNLHTFETFWNTGFQEAYYSATEYQRENLKSLAFMYIPNIHSEELPRSVRLRHRERKRVPIRHMGSGSARSYGNEQDAAQGADKKPDQALYSPRENKCRSPRTVEAE